MDKPLSRRNNPISRENRGTQADRGTVAQSDLRRVGRACDRLEAARKELIDAIMAAVASGESYRDIGHRAGLSHQRVQQIVKKEMNAPETDRPTPGGS